MTLTVQSDVILCGSGFCSAPATRYADTPFGRIHACEQKNHDLAAVESLFDTDEDDCQYN